MYLQNKEVGSILQRTSVVTEILTENVKHVLILPHLRSDWFGAFGTGRTEVSVTLGWKLFLL